MRKRLTIDLRQCLVQIGQRAVEVAAKKAPAFKPGKEMREGLNKPDS